MKTVRTLTSSQYKRLNDTEAAKLVASGEWVYTTKEAFRAFMNRTRKKHPSGFYKGARKMREQFKRMSDLKRIGNSKGKGTIRKQIVTVGLKRELVESYKTKSGETKNRYKATDAKEIKTIKHPVKQATKPISTNIKKIKGACVVCNSESPYNSNIKASERVCAICKRKAERGIIQ